LVVAAFLELAVKNQAAVNEGHGEGVFVVIAGEKSGAVPPG
jgi:hypothetical protein